MGAKYKKDRKPLHSRHEDGSAMHETLQVSEARSQFSTLLERARKGEWQLIGRRGHAEVVLADAAELARLLAEHCPFEPEVFFEEPGVGIYLHELDVHGVGDTLAAAQSELIDAALVYAAAWDDDLRGAPNHAFRMGHVRRLQLAADDAEAGRILFGDDCEPPTEQ